MKRNPNRSKNPNCAFNVHTALPDLYPSEHQANEPTNQPTVSYERKTFLFFSFLPAKPKTINQNIPYRLRIQMRQLRGKVRTAGAVRWMQAAISLWQARREQKGQRTELEDCSQRKQPLMLTKKNPKIKPNDCRNLSGMNCIRELCTCVHKRPW